MSVLNTLSEFTSNINVALSAHLTIVSVKKTKFVLQLVDILYTNGLVRGFQIKKGEVYIYLKYSSGVSVITSLKMVSRPGKRIF